MLKIGLCGGSGSGKGAVSLFFAERGYFVIDTDTVCHELFAVDCECTRALRAEFGDSIFDAPCCVKRKKLSEIVFSDKEKLKRLNSITHYYILNRVRELIADAETESRFRGAVVDAPLLFESGFDAECDFIVAVLADKNVRIDRVVERDGISRERAIARINNQKSDDFLIDKSDFVIENNGTLLDLKQCTMLVIDKIENKIV